MTQMEGMPGFVYVFSANGTEFYKIGLTTKGNPIDRLKSVQTGCPYPVTMAALFPTGDVILTESRMHRMLGAHRKTGEWFNLDDEMFPMAIAAISATLVPLKPSRMNLFSSRDATCEDVDHSEVMKIISESEIRAIQKGVEAAVDRAISQGLESAIEKSMIKAVENANATAINRLEDYAKRGEKRFGVFVSEDREVSIETQRSEREVSRICEAVRVFVDSFDECDLLVAPPPNGTLREIMDYVQHMTGSTVSKGYVSKVLARFREEEQES